MRAGADDYHQHRGGQDRQGAGRAARVGGTDRAIPHDHERRHRPRAGRRPVCRHAARDRSGTVGPAGAGVPRSSDRPDGGARLSCVHLSTSANGRICPVTHRTRRSGRPAAQRQAAAHSGRHRRGSRQRGTHRSRQSGRRRARPGRGVVRACGDEYGRQGRLARGPPVGVRQCGAQARRRNGRPRLRRGSGDRLTAARGRCQTPRLGSARTPHPRGLGRPLDRPQLSRGDSIDRRRPCNHAGAAYQVGR